MNLIMQVKWRILAYGINEQEYGPNMAFFLCSHASLRLLFLAALFTQIISIAGFQKPILLLLFLASSPLSCFKNDKNSIFAQVVLCGGGQDSGGVSVPIHPKL